MRISNKIKNLVTNEYSNGVGSIILSKKYNISSDSILRFCRDIGISIRADKPAYRLSVTHNFFENIDTEEKAYWLGFLMADGNVDGNAIKIMLKSDDIEHLHKFKKSIKADHKVSQSSIYDRCSFCFRSDRTANDLKKYGITENKSLTLTPKINTIHPSLHKHFWRGVVDGDGWISKNKQKKRLTLVGTRQLLDCFIDFITCDYSIRQPNPNKNTFSLSVGGEDSKNLITYLYKNSTVFLDRKYKIAEGYFHERL